MASCTDATMQQTYLSALNHNTADQQQCIKIAINNINNPPDYPGQMSVCEDIEPEMHYLSPHNSLDWVSLEYLDAALRRYSQTCEYTSILLEEEQHSNLRRWDSTSEEADARSHSEMFMSDRKYDSTQPTPMKVDSPHFSPTTPNYCRRLAESPHFLLGMPKYRGWVTPDYIRAHFARQQPVMLNRVRLHRPVKSLAEKLAEVSGPPRPARTIKQMAQDYKN